MEKTNLPIILLRGIIVLPYAELKIDLIDELDTKIIELASKNHDGYVLLVSPNNFLEEKIEINKLPKLGVVGKITKKTTLPNGCIRVTIEGKRRAVINNYVSYEGYDDVFAGVISSPTRYAMDLSDEEALVRKLKTELENYINLVPYSSNSILAVIDEIKTVSKLADVVANYMPTSFERKYEILNTVNPHTRVMMDLEDIQKELDVYEIEKRLDTKLKKEMDKSQKEYILREKIRLIKEELGDISSKDDEIEELRGKIKKLKCPKNITKKLERELKKYESTPQASPEIGIIRNYIDVLINLPWNTYTKDNTDLKKVKEVLDKSHYGLSEIKERIIEYLAVKERNVSNKAPIICLVGPPGVGKTSLAKSVAEAMNRKFVKISVGGVNDPAEIIGHRRTYMGANPGRIINALKKCGSNNPVFLIDEVDKMTKDIKGDPASSLLEVLDPEQNDKFYDNYVEEAYDLSKIMFILTANYIAQIPDELKDRLEIIHIPSYTEYEKKDIALNYLIPKLMDEVGLTPFEVVFESDAILEIIRCYTKEAGVRELSRMISKILRKIVKKMLLENNEAQVIVKKDSLEEYLGKKIYTFYRQKETLQVGVVNGLAYTPFGGDVLKIETTYYKGKGNLILTGSLGDVIKESASIALSYIKANYKKFNVDDSIFSSDIHIHLPEGAVNKEGPSAGIALTTSIISAFSNKKISSKIAMTGEITLQGDVLAIGGVREKVLGAYRTGVKKIYLPKENKKDLEEIPKEIKDKIKFILVSNYDEIIKNI